MPASWEKTLTQEIGHQWVQDGESLLPCVPSAIVVNEYNFLINPRYPEAAKVKLVDTESFLFDNRLK